ncbi:MAG: hypothetical protein JXA62_08650 [Candidatus Aminicenantes bacterium]|nr:hypothetical protein [Candidatus Aminicenantes bacterium]
MKKNILIEGCRGNILAAMLFVLLCGALCMTLLTHSIGHHRIMKIRRMRAAGLAELQDQLSLEIHRVFDTLNHVDLYSLEDPAVELFSLQTFPDHTSGSARLQHFFSHENTSIGNMDRIQVRLRVLAAQIKGRYCMEGEIQSTFLQGAVPIQHIPLLLQAHVPAGRSAREWLSTQGVRLPGTVVPTLKAGGFDLELKRLVQRALDLGNLELTWSEVRRRLGLEVTEAPPPPGIYLVRDSECIHAVLVQGDLNKLEFSSHPGYQYIKMTQGTNTYILEYEPEGTILDCWIPDPLSTTVFSECIVINGNCYSVATRQEPGKEIRAFHPDSRITLLVSGQVTVTSSLEREGLGVRRIPSPGISIVCGKTGAINAGDQGIQLSTGNHSVLDAALISAHDLTNSENSVHINGNICAGNLDNSGEITFTFARGQQDLLEELTARNIRLIQSIKLLRIEEVRRDEID